MPAPKPPAAVQDSDPPQASRTEEPVTTSTVITHRPGKGHTFFYNLVLYCVGQIDGIAVTVNGDATGAAVATPPR